MKFKFRSKIWKFKGKGGWFFVTLPKNLSKQIRSTHGRSEEGWGRLKTFAEISPHKWQTAIWYDKKHESYLLPIKAAIRKSEDLKIGSIVQITLFFEDDEDIYIKWNKRKF